LARGAEVPLRLLLLGGTKFLGRAVAEAALERSDELTLFNRGRTNPQLFPEAEQLRGDRDGDLSALEGREWDAVVDPSGFVPRVVAASAALLTGAVGHYVFLSSISVYRPPIEAGLDESAAVVELDDPTSEDVQADYGGLKVLCERAVEERFPGRATHVRAGLIAGPHDPTGRFTYWADRLRRGGEILAPGPPKRPVQFVDVRDLADWILLCAERRTNGVFNATGEGTSWDALLAGGDVTWVSDEFLRDHEVGQWMELPLWLADPDWAGIHAADVSRAVAAGLRFRPVADTLEGAAHAPLVEGVGLTPEREAELLAAWHGG
jgi:2'-hydroxyisoflavone reductase